MQTLSRRLAKLALSIGLLGGALLAAPETAHAQCVPGPNQVAFFSDANFGGACVVLDEGTYNFASSPGSPIGFGDVIDNDTLSSVKVGAGATVSLYQHWAEGYCGTDYYGPGYLDCSGDYLTTSADIADLSTVGLSDTISSVIIFGVPDSDGDGVPDELDVCEGGDDNFDSDLDNVPDFCDACPNDVGNDSDGDGSCDSADLCLGDDATGDGDGDGICSDQDPCIGTSNDGDADGDLICDGQDVCHGDDSTGDSDADMVCDDLDACRGNDLSGDHDGDAVCNDIDACPADTENDADGDGICEVDDNCDVTPNGDQADLDGDTLGDACDPDIDGDGVANEGDNCVFDVNADQADTDADGAGNACDLDLDGDAVLDAADACVPSPLGAVVNANGCAVADLCPCANSWKNHGAYVRCVAHTTGAFVAGGLITKAEKDAIVSAAGQSSCGK